MGDIFDPSQQPDMSPNGPSDFQYQGNAMYQQQQAMLYPQPDMSVQVTRPGMGQTMALAGQGLSMGMSNVMQGGMQASNHVMQVASNMSNTAHRFISGPTYHDQYAGPNNFALETSFRREMASYAGADHNSFGGRLLLGGFRPDFMTDKAFARQMEAAQGVRFTTANKISMGADALAAGTMFIPGLNMVTSLVAAPIMKFGAHTLTSFNHGMRAEQAGADSWARYANKRIGFGGDGYVDKASAMGIGMEFEEHDLGAHAGWTKFMGKAISKKINLRPEIQYEELNKSMEDMGMFSQRTTGGYDKEKITSAVKAIASEMKELAGIARVLKEEIPKAAAELQKAGGFGYEQSAKYMGLTRQAAGVAATTGLDFRQITGASGQMMQAARGMGFNAEGTGEKYMDTLSQMSGLKSAGILGAGVNEVEFAQKIQMSAMQNARTNPFAMMAPGQSASNFRNEMTSNPKEFFNRQNGTMNGTGLPDTIQTMDNFLGAVRKLSGQGAIDRYGESNLLMRYTQDTLLPNGTFEEQKALVDIHYLGMKNVNQIKEDENVIAASGNGTLVQKLMQKRGLSRAAAEEEQERMLGIAKGHQKGGLMDMEKHLGSFNRGDSLRSEEKDNFYRRFGGSEALANKVDTNTAHWKLTEGSWFTRLRGSIKGGWGEGGTGIFSHDSKERTEFVSEEIKVSGKTSPQAHALFEKLATMTPEERDYYKARRGNEKISYGDNAELAVEISAQLNNEMNGDVFKAFDKAFDSAKKKGLNERDSGSLIGSIIANGGWKPRVQKLVNEKTGTDSEQDKIGRHADSLGGRAAIAFQEEQYSKLSGEKLSDQAKWYFDSAVEKLTGSTLNGTAFAAKSTEDQLSAIDKLVDNREEWMFLGDKEEARVRLRGRMGMTEDYRRKEKAYLAKEGTLEERNRAFVSELAGRRDISGAKYGTLDRSQYIEWSKKKLSAHQGAIDKFMKNDLDGYNFRIATESKGDVGTAQLVADRLIGGEIATSLAGSSDENDRKLAAVLREDSKTGAGARRAFGVQLGAIAGERGIGGTKESEFKAEEKEKQRAMETYRSLIGRGLTDEGIRKDMQAVGKGTNYHDYIFGGKKVESDGDRQGLAKAILKNRTLTESLLSDSKFDDDATKTGQSSARQLLDTLKGGNASADDLNRVTQALQRSGTVNSDKINADDLNLADKGSAAAAITKLSDVLDKVLAAMGGTTLGTDAGGGASSGGGSRSSGGTLSPPKSAGTKADPKVSAFPIDEGRAEAFRKAHPNREDAEAKKVADLRVEADTALSRGGFPERSLPKIAIPGLTH